jgi:hypothetical protein
VERRLQTVDDDARLDGTKYLRFPTRSAYIFHERAHIELAKQYAKAHDLEGAQRELERAAAVYPDDNTVPTVLRRIRDDDPQAEELVLAL